MKTMNFNKCATIAIMALTMCFGSAAQVPIEKSQYSRSLVAPKYFGPYAFPVPDMLDDGLRGKLSMELSADYVNGTMAGKNDVDKTFAPTFRVNIPLWTDRATLGIWGEMHEWYSDTPGTRLLRRVDSSLPLKKSDSGNVYFSLDMLVLKERKYIPSITVRAATQSATGDDYEYARHYDAPGYFFDLTFGKSFRTGDCSNLRAALSTGFLCWQIDRGTQNDAVMLSAQLSYNHKHFDMTASYGQYTGWEKDGDGPKVIKARVSAKIGRFSPFVYVQHGLKDWPFTLVRTGVNVSFDILKKFQ